MRRNPILGKDEPLSANKVNSYLKEIDIRSIAGRKQAAPFDPTPEKKIPEPTYSTQNKDRRVRNKSTEDNRSTSEMGRLDLMDVTSSARRTNTLQRGSSLQPYNNSNLNNETKNGNLKLKLPKLAAQESELVETPTKINNNNKNYNTAKTDDPEALALKNTISMTLQVPKKRRLQPLKHDKIMSFSKTKAGSTGKQAKTNQDAIVIEHKLPFGLKIFCVCDGHGVNGHLVSGFIRTQLVSKNILILEHHLSQHIDHLI